VAQWRLASSPKFFVRDGSFYIRWFKSRILSNDLLRRIASLMKAVNCPDGYSGASDHRLVSDHETILVDFSYLACSATIHADEVAFHVSDHSAHL